jgi:hypothetical protein
MAIKQSTTLIRNRAFGSPVLTPDNIAGQDVRLPD